MAFGRWKWRYLTTASCLEMDHRGMSLGEKRIEEGERLQPTEKRGMEESSIGSTLLEKFESTRLFNGSILDLCALSLLKKSARHYGCPYNLVVI